MKKITNTLTALFMTATFASAQTPAFPGAEGFGAQASGGRGGQVIYVTNLNYDGPGSLQEALNTSGPRYILFKVSGVIDGTVEIPVGNGDFTIAGQTSPNGIIVRGLSAYNNEDPSVSNFIVRHLRLRPGDDALHPCPNWLNADGFTLGGVHNAIVDHCSMAHASDEEVDISRSSRLTIQNCMFSETLGEHGYLGGMLTNYRSASSNHDSLSIHHNAWNRVGGRMPEFSCESPECDNHTMHAELSCNLFWDQHVETWYNPSIVPGGSTNTYFIDLNMVNNYSVGRSTYSNGMFAHNMLELASNDLFVSGNTMNLYPSFSDYDLFYCCNDFPTNGANTDPGVATHLTNRHPYPSITYTATNDIVTYMRSNAGAFPRDPMDQRLLAPLQSGNIVTTPVDEAGADDAFLITSNGTTDPDTDNDGMPDYWESLHGLDPSVQDHNGTGLSMGITGVAGYTNLECYLNCLSDALVNGSSTSSCGIQISRNNPAYLQPKMSVFPNPAQDRIRVDILSPSAEHNIPMIITDLAGTVLIEKSLDLSAQSQSLLLNVEDLSAGMYLLNIGGSSVRFCITR